MSCYDRFFPSKILPASDYTGSSLEFGFRSLFGCPENGGYIVGPLVWETSLSRFATRSAFMGEVWGEVRAQDSRLQVSCFEFELYSSEKLSKITIFMRRPVQSMTGSYSKSLESPTDHENNPHFTAGGSLKAQDKGPRITAEDSNPNVPQCLSFSVFDFLGIKVRLQNPKRQPSSRIVTRRLIVTCSYLFRR